jgi:hypothetical protein
MRIATICAAAAAAATVLLSVPASAQTQVGGQGYWITGIGGFFEKYGATGPIYQFGGGGEALIDRRVGIGATLVYAGAAGDFLPLLAINARVHFPPPAHGGDDVRTMVPFVTGGYTRYRVFSGSEGKNAINVGAGLTFWFADDHGVMLDVRDTIDQGASLQHFLTISVGYAFRRAAHPRRR